MELSNAKKIDASRDTGIGRWVQEIGKYRRPFLLTVELRRRYSVARFLRSRPRTLPSRLNG